MTQLSLELNRFDAAMERINARIEANSERALQDIKALAEHHRRSPGQIVRWQEYHFFAVQREGRSGNDHES